MTHFTIDNDKPLLFSFKPVAVISGLSDGWCWELSFDTNDFIYKIECGGFFENPIECDRHLEEFCSKNNIVINKEIVY